MANELTISADMKFAKDRLEVQRRVSRKQFTVTGDTFTWQVQNIGTTYEALDVGSDIATAGWGWFRNLEEDEGNYVDVGLQISGSIFVPFMTLQPGEFALVPLATTAIYAEADTAAVDLEYLILAD